VVGVGVGAARSQVCACERSGASRARAALTLLRRMQGGRRVKRVPQNYKMSGARAYAQRVRAYGSMFKYMLKSR